MMMNETAAFAADDDVTAEERAALAEDDAPRAVPAAEGDENEMRVDPIAPFAAAEPANADANLKIVADYESRDQQRFEDGDITATEYRRALREAADKREEIKWAHHKADLASDMQEQVENRAWMKAVREFMSTTGVAIKSDPMRRAFDRYVQDVTGDAANAHLSDKARLAKAHRRFMADMPSGAAESVKIAGGPSHTDFAAIDRMIDSDPLRAEEALARMSPEEIERYLS